MRPPREDRLEAAIYAIEGIIPGAACYTTDDGHDLLRTSTVSVDIAEMAGRVVDQLAMLEDKWADRATT